VCEIANFNLPSNPTVRLKFHFMFTMKNVVWTLLLTFLTLLLSVDGKLIRHKRIRKTDHNPKCDTSKTFYGQECEDKVLYERFFKSRQPGIFVEIGGFTGRRVSNTYFFEKELGWRGVLIEGSPSNFPVMVKNRPDALNVGRAVCSKSGLVDFYHGNKILPTGGIIEHMRPFNPRHHSFVDRLKRNKGLSSPVRFDVEGAEEIVLKTMDWSIPIEVVIIELDRKSNHPEDTERLIEYIIGKGFVDSGIIIPLSSIYVNKTFSVDVSDFSTIATQLHVNYMENPELHKLI